MEYLNYSNFFLFMVFFFSIKISRAHAKSACYMSPKTVRLPQTTNPKFRRASKQPITINPFRFYKHQHNIEEVGITFLTHTRVHNALCQTDDQSAIYYRKGQI